MKISKIIIYDEPSVPEIRVLNLVRFIKEKTAIEVEVRENIFLKSDKNTAEKLASIKIMNTRKPFEPHHPALEEIDFEIKTAQDSSKLENIVMYDGFEFQKIVSELISKDQSTADIFHIIITNKLTCTYDDSDYRYHGRAIICSNPTIISITGIVEAPAKPKQYYLDLITKMNLGLNIDSIKEKYQGTFIDYHDNRLSTVIEGYAMQGIFYYLTGEAFCHSKDCRLFNPHWQEDLIYSQIEKGKLCDHHEKFLKDLVINLN